MRLSEAIELWRGSGYRRINGYLIQKHTGSRLQAYKYTGALAPEEYDVEEVVDALKNGMSRVDTNILYYRGDSKTKQTNCKVETFISISVNEEDADSFKNDGLVYEITLHEGVKGLNTGVEGEIVLEDGCFWRYHGQNKVSIYPPSANLDYAYCSYKRGGSRKKRTKRTRARTRKPLNKRIP
jgi:hypothetical protein